MYFFANARDSSLVTGSKSHKQVDSDVSRLLQRYYDPVSTHSPVPEQHWPTSYEAYTLRCLRWQRALLHLPLPDEVGPYSSVGFVRHHRRTGGFDLAATHGPHLCPRLFAQELCQCRSALEGVEDFGGCGFG